MIIWRDLAHSSPAVFFGAHTWSKTNNLRTVSHKSLDFGPLCSTESISDDVGAINGSTRVCICCTNGRNDDGCSVMSSVNACKMTRMDGLEFASDRLGLFATFKDAAIKAARAGVVISLVRD